jgi:penicillin amidase
MKKDLRIWRDRNGIPHVDADNESDMYWGQGYAHATDRGMQMLLMRILGQGRASELLDSSDEILKVDMFFRRMNWSGNTHKEINSLSPQEKQHLASYCEGANAVFSQNCPWEFKLMGYRPEQWRGEDTVMISRMVGYLTLVQSQAEMERLFVELVQAGVSKEKLDELFPGILGGLDIELIKKVTLNERIVPFADLWGIAVPRMMASNNWAVSGAKTASGKPIVANDPHLEVNRLPNVWSEIVLKTKNRYAMGGSMPGFPGILTGRTADIAMAATYSFVDAIDSWIEKCRDGKFYREDGDQWINFRQRKEVIKRKKKPPVEVIFFENEHGVLDGDPRQEGYYLATRWAAAESGAGALSSVLGMWNVKSVDACMDTLGKVETGWNFVFADLNGDIGYQMSGRVPKRRQGNSGFVPLPGWSKENDWQGFLTHEELPRVKNPEEGYFATANQDLNRYGTAKPINMPMAAYRADRINAILKKGTNLTVSDMFKMHFDVYSLQAKYFMDILKPLLPDTAQGRILKDWDFEYTPESKGAFLFERFYKELYMEVFGKNGFGEKVVEYLWGDAGIFADFYDNFDRILLSEKSAWFEGRSREQLFRQAALRALAAKPRKWGDVQQFMMTHILFGGKLPAFLGFDRGPIVGIGGRATIHQGQIYRSAGRDTSFMPSYRVVTDLARNDFFSNLAGGPSDRRFSKWYCSELNNWISGKYKKVAPHSDQEKKAFKYREIELKKPRLSDLMKLAKRVKVDLQRLAGEKETKS